jgi:three-Cys-motif partner protein
LPHASGEIRGRWLDPAQNKLDKNCTSVQYSLVAVRKRGTSRGKAHRFGGDWTTSKLAILGEYLKGYTTALKKQPFQTEYVDAFAGTGYLALADDHQLINLMFPDLAADAPQALLDGSARIALKTTPRFDKYIFIESKAKRCRELEALKAEFPVLAPDIDVRRGDANVEIQALCARDWSSRRAVLFLDPYGTQVEWTTIEAVAATKAIDLWILFPLGIGVNRLLTRSGEIPKSWRRRLDLLLGTQEWYDAFYRVEHTPTLFDTQETKVVKATMETIGRYFNDRLAGIFAGVAPEPRVLLNSANCPLYLLCFAVGNVKGAPVALRIANHLLKTVA